MVELMCRCVGQQRVGANDMEMRLAALRALADVSGVARGWVRVWVDERIVAWLPGSLVECLRICADW